MRVNLPVTDVERELPTGESIVTRTDLKGRITYANTAFCKISGFTREELVGSPHNIVRHPDMPKEAFADLWKTIKGDRPWTALVKNRCKNGDYYWVEANVTPIKENGVLIGYMSVRTKPSRERIAAATRLYAPFKEGNATHLRFERGSIVRVDWLGRSLALRRLSLRTFIWLNLVLLAGLFASLGAAGLWNAGAPAGELAWLRYWLIGAATGGALLSAGLGIYLTRRVTTPLRHALRTAHGVIGGDIWRQFTAPEGSEVGRLFQALNQMNGKFAAVILDVSANTEVIESATSEIAQGNSDLSARTEAQAASVEETASSMEEFTSTVKQNSDSARQGNEVALSASSVATRGGQVVTQVVTTMNEITQASKKIADIIGVIDTIAFQTNILALNAAVEAARAGEQGRGFAVVASEVRNLAQRTATAAKEIKELIVDSVTKVESGAQLVDEAGRTMAEIVTSVKKVSEIMDDITHASHEQFAGVEQVNKAIMSIDDTTQRNAALVEQAAAASANLHEQAQRLAEVVSMFKLARTQTPPDCWDGVERRSPKRAKNVTRLPTTKQAKAPAPIPCNATRN